MNKLIWHNPTVTRKRRYKLNRHRSFMLWFTGLSGAGKSTLANAVEEELYKLNCSTYVLDGDNVRHGLNSDLGFSISDRKENLRRIGEIGKLLLDAGVITLAAFISPIREERENVRSLYPHGDFLEIYCSASLAVCEKRDTKGMYKKAKSGEIPEFTGISSPYEAPTRADIEINTGTLPLKNCVEIVIQEIQNRNMLNNLMT